MKNNALLALRLLGLEHPYCGRSGGIPIGTQPAHNGPDRSIGLNPRGAEPIPSWPDSRSDQGTRPQVPNTDAVDPRSGSAVGASSGRQVL